MYHVKAFAPVSYWKKLDAILRRDVPSLYLTSSVNPNHVFNSDEFFTACMIYNNVKLIPSDHEMDLPEPVESRKYPFFESNWEIHPITLVVGPPEIKTCGNHRIHTLSEFDFVAWRNPQSLSIELVGKLPLEDSLKEFFCALSVFQNVAGFKALQICDYMPEGKYIKISPRYVASKEEYQHYWTETIRLCSRLEQVRRENHWCLWCYQTFIGMTIQGLSKGILFENPEHIPKAMPDILLALHFIQVPLIYITRVVLEFFKNIHGKDALTAYTQFTDLLLEESKLMVPCDNPMGLSENIFESLLSKKDIELIQLAIERYRYDLESLVPELKDKVESFDNDPSYGNDPSYRNRPSCRNDSSHRNDPSYRNDLPNGQSAQQENSNETLQVLLGQNGKVFRIVNSQTGVPAVNIMDYAKKPKGRRNKKFREKTANSMTRRKVGMNEDADL